MTSSILSKELTLTQAQVELLDELKTMDLFNKDSEYDWFIKELSDLGIESVNDFDDKYYGCIDGPEEKAGSEFAQQMAEDCGEIPEDLPSWIEIDWVESWRNLSWDYSTIERENAEHGYVIETFFFHNYWWITA